MLLTGQQMWKFLAILLLLPASLAAQTVLPGGNANYERVLLPITVMDAGGAFGTRWTTEVWLPPVGDVIPAFAPSTCDPPCPEPGGPPSNASYPIGFFRTHPGEPPGSLLYVRNDEASLVHVSLRLMETSGTTRLLPLQLPVVPEHEFSSSTVHVLGVPVSATSRVMVRVYGIDPDTPGDVDVRVIREDSPLQVLLSDDLIHLAVAQTTYVAGPVSAEIRPPAAQFALNESGNADVSLVRLEITPMTPGLRIWAFVSVTDNVTQQITLRTP